MKKESPMVMTMVHEDKQWFSQKEAAKAYGISESSIKHARLSGDLPFSKLFGKVIIRKKDIEKCIERVT